MKEKSAIGFFEKFLTLWVLICMGLGVLIGHFLPSVGEFLSSLDVASVNIPIAVYNVWNFSAVFLRNL